MGASEGRLAGRIALVTGASRGIGAAVAERFAAEGAHLVLVARDKKELETVDDRVRSAGGEQATLVPLDLTDGSGIDRLGGAVAERWGHLDVLVGNAGTLGTLAPMGHIRPEVWERVMDLNVTANWRLIQSFDPLLRAAPDGRAMFVTSGAARRPIAYWGAYGASKAALEMMIGIYAAEVAKSSVRVNLVDPGAVRTAMRALAMPGEDPMTLPEPESITDVFVDLAAADCTRHAEVVRAQ